MIAAADPPERAGETGPRIVGHEAELAVLDGFVRAARASRALVLAGEAGIGKTTLWEAGIAAAREHGVRVLSARASGAEARLAFASLIDLFDRVDAKELRALPAPQLRALEAALLRAEPDGAPPEPGAIALAVLNGLRALAARRRLLVAVDDVQWLDPPSAEVLAYAARRLAGDPVWFLLARRPGRSTGLERALEPGGLEPVAVGPLSLGAVRRLLLERLGLGLPRQLLRRVVDTTLGNPLFALEVGRTLAERGLPAIGEELPVPDAVEDLLGTRVARLPGAVFSLLLAAGLSADLRTSHAEAIAGASALDDAVDAGVLVVDGDRVRASHPLLAAAARKRSRARARRELHRTLARVVSDEELRARHLALAAERPDAELAVTVAAAAADASSRGARGEAAELAEHALRLTPAGAGERTERLLALAGYLGAVGEKQRVTDLLVPELDSLPPGAARGRALLLLCQGGVIESDLDLRRHLTQALRESRADAGLRAAVLAELSGSAAVIRVEKIPDAERWAQRALRAAARAGPDVERLALEALGWARSLRGRPIDDVCARFLAASDAAVHVALSPERVAGQRLVWRGELDEARKVLTRLLSIADRQDEPYSYALQRLHVCEAELRGGNWAAAARLLDEWAECSDRELVIWPMYERCRALLAAGRGFPDEAERWAAEAVALAEEKGVRWDLLEAERARGVAALLAHEPARALESLRPVWEHAEREGVDEPGVFPVAPELVEALVETGDLDGAHAVTVRLAELAEQQDHPWGLATASRCRGLVRLAAGGYDEDAAAELERAASRYAQLGLRFDEARSLHALGRAQRRHRKWGASRRSLERAVQVFEEIDSPGWKAEAGSELLRVGARRRSRSGELTEAEERVARLAAEGLANREIAQTLFVTVSTVERHLSHAYAKLGVRSRAQLARRLPGREAS